MKLTPQSQRRFALAAVCLSALMLGLEISSVPPALAAIEQAMAASFRQLQWIMAAYTIAMTTILMAVGTLADRYGRKRIFLTGIVAFAVTSLICGVTNTASVLIIARFLQGLSAAMMLICQIAILSEQFRQGTERSNAFACWGIIFGIGLGFGPIVGSVILLLADWRWVFLVHVVLAVITFFLAWSSVHESGQRHTGRLDIAGMLTLSVAVFCLVLFVTQGAVLGFGSPAALGIIAVAVFSFIAFVVAERRSSQPMIDFAVFRNRHFSGALLGSMGQNFSFWPFIIYLPVYFTVVLGYDSLYSGLALLAYTLPTLFMPPLAERLALRYQPKAVIPVGLAVIGLGFLLMKMAMFANQPWLLLLGCMVAGTGLGLVNTTSSNTVTAAVAAKQAGMASGADTSARMISLAFNIAVMGLILVSGVAACLATVLPPADRWSIAEKIASGDVYAASAWIPTEAAISALAYGFGWVMLYAAASALLLALGSYRIFRQKTLVEPLQDQVEQP